jgi:hypothetical protein
VNKLKMQKFNKRAPELKKNAKTPGSEEQSRRT